MTPSTPTEPGGQRPTPARSAGGGVNLPKRLAAAVLVAAVWVVVRGIEALDRVYDPDAEEGER